MKKIHDIEMKFNNLIYEQMVGFNQLQKKRKKTVHRESWYLFDFAYSFVAVDFIIEYFCYMFG